MKINVNDIEIEVIGDVDSVVVKDKKVTITPKVTRYSDYYPIWVYTPSYTQTLHPQATWTSTTSNL